MDDSASIRVPACPECAQLHWQAIAAADYQHQLLIIATIVVAEAWRSTSIIVIILVGGLQAIPREYAEAADVFYASPWQKLWHVTLPLLRPTLRTALILRTVLAFEVFATVIALAGSSLSVLATKANNAYTQYQEPHLAAAYGILIVLLSLLSTALFLVMLPVCGRSRPRERAVPMKARAFGKYAGAVILAVWVLFPIDLLTAGALDNPSRNGDAKVRSTLPQSGLHRTRCVLGKPDK